MAGYYTAQQASAQGSNFVKADTYMTTYLRNMNQVSLFGNNLLGIWMIIFSMIALGITSNNSNAENLIQDVKSGLILQKEGELWISEHEKFGAFFPSKPEILDVSGTAASTKSYYSLKQYSEGNAQFSIRVSPIAMNMNSKPLSVQKELLELFINQRATIIGAAKETKKLQWGEFSDGRPQLFYEYEFFEQGQAISSRGFVIPDGERLLDVNVLHLSTLPSSEKREIAGFLGTFSLFDF